MKTRTKVARQRAYTTLRARTLNALIEAHNDDARRVGPARQVNRGAGAVAIQVARLTITGLPDITETDLPADYLQCVQYVEGTEGDDVPVVAAFMNVAKPLGVRPSRLAHGDLTFTYTDHNTRIAAFGATVETQTLVEPYVVGDEILAVNLVVGGTGVATTSGISGAVIFQELPSTPRWWAVAE